MENKELLEQVAKTLEATLPEVVETVVGKKFEAEMSKTFKELEDMKAELKKFSFDSKKSDPAISKKYKETFMVSLVKDVIDNSISSEKAFAEAIERTTKAMNTWNPTEWAEFVFEQFEADILAVLDTFGIINDVRVYNINKGNDLTLVKWENAVQTYFTAEWIARTESEYETEKINIDVAKLTTMTKLTEEFLDDTMTIPDVYQFLVRCFGESQAKFLETQLLSGTWDIEGVFTNEDVNVVEIDDSDNIDDDTIIEVITKAVKKFTWGEKFYFSKYMWGKLMQIRTTDGSPLYPELRNATPTLMGYPVVLSSVEFIQNETEKATDDKIALMFGNLQYYALVRRRGLTIERGLDGNDFSEDKITVKSTVRCGWALTFPEALTIVKIANS
jgi:HK97 family phage major capsid protein